MSDLQAAWTEHVGKLTLEQLSIPDAYKEHLDKFEMQLVATTLGHTVIGSVHDVQECIASLLRAHPVGGAEAMAKLANTRRGIMNAAMVNEVLEKVKILSLDGYNRAVFKLPKLKAYRPYMVNAGGLDAIQETLKSQGYGLTEETRREHENGSFVINKCWVLTWE